jgi:hypothetical protein
MDLVLTVLGTGNFNNNNNNIYNKPCRWRNTDYWVDDTLGGDNPPADVSRRISYSEKKIYL